MDRIFQQKQVILPIFGFLLVSIVLLTAFNLWDGNSRIREQFSQKEQEVLQNYNDKLNNILTRVVSSSESYLESSEFKNKVREITLAGPPYFVYTPQTYGEEIDHWDRVMLAQRQVWMLRHFLPVIKDNSIDQINLYLSDPHNNLHSGLKIPFLEVKKQWVSFFSYSNKGVFKSIEKYSGDTKETEVLNESFFEKVLFNPDRKVELYSAMGLKHTQMNRDQLPIIESRKDGDLFGISGKDRLIIRAMKTVMLDLYDWKLKKQKPSLSFHVSFNKFIDPKWLNSLKKSDSGYELGMVVDGNIILSVKGKKTLKKLSNSNQIQIEERTYTVKLLQLEQVFFQGDIQLFVLTPRSLLDEKLNLFYFKTLLFTSVLLLLLIPFMIYIYRSSARALSDPNKTVSAVPLFSPVDVPNYFLIEDQGITKTIPANKISHISVMDHYCTIFYKEGEDWKQWSILERLKTFEEKYPHLLQRISRSSLINLEHILKIQPVQRKLTMRGEPETSFTISQSKLEEIQQLISSSSLIH